MNPLEVDVAVPNVGDEIDEIDDIAVTCAEPLSMFGFEVVMVAVELVKAATPLTVTKPLPLMATEPDAVAVPA